MNADGSLSRCALNGLATVNTDYDAYREQKRKLEAACLAMGYPNIAAWNDAPTTKYEDVIKTLKELDI